jgi:hypothetical protein
MKSILHLGERLLAAAQVPHRLGTLPISQHRTFLGFLQSLTEFTNVDSMLYKSLVSTDPNFFCILS